MDKQTLMVSLASDLAMYAKEKANQSGGDVSSYLERVLIGEKSEEEGQRIQRVDMGDGTQGVVLYYLAREEKARKVLRNSAIEDQEYDPGLFEFGGICINGTGVYLSNRPEHLHERVNVDCGPEIGTRFWILKVTLRDEPSQYPDATSDPESLPPTYMLLNWPELIQAYPYLRSCRHWFTTAEAVNPYVLRVELFDPDASAEDPDLESAFT